MAGRFDGGSVNILVKLQERARRANKKLDSRAGIVSKNLLPPKAPANLSVPAQGLSEVWPCSTGFSQGFLELNLTYPDKGHEFISLVLSSKCVFSW